MANQRIRIDQHSGVGLVWAAGWLFTIGYLDLAFWRAVLAIFVWPYFLGSDLATLPDAPPQTATGV